MPLAVTLDDKYVLESGRVYLTGTQALVRLPMMQRQRDLAAGLNTGGYISGYRGSPLGGFDRELWQANQALLKTSSGSSALAGHSTRSSPPPSCRRQPTGGQHGSRRKVRRRRSAYWYGKGHRAWNGRATPSSHANCSPAPPGAAASCSRSSGDDHMRASRPPSALQSVPDNLVGRPAGHPPAGPRHHAGICWTSGLPRHRDVALRRACGPA